MAFCKLNWMAERMVFDLGSISGSTGLCSLPLTYSHSQSSRSAINDEREITPYFITYATDDLALTHESIIIVLLN